MDGHSQLLWLVPRSSSPRRDWSFSKRERDEYCCHGHVLPPRTREIRRLILVSTPVLPLLRSLIYSPTHKVDRSWCYFVGLFLGPIISGAVTEATSFRIFFWVCTAAQGISIIGLGFLFPETRRLQTATPTLAVAESEAEVKAGDKNLEAGGAAHVESGSPAPTTSFVPAVRGEGKPSRAQFNIFQEIDRKAAHSVVRHFLTPLRILFFPIVLWAAVSMGAAADALLAVNILQSQALASPPYNFSPSQVGYANFALVVGGVVGLAVAGPWSDYISQKATLKNKGIREPEMRLVALLPFAIVAVIGLVVSTLLFQHGGHGGCSNTGASKGVWCWRPGAVGLASGHHHRFRFHRSSGRCYSDYRNYLRHRLLQTDLW